MMKLLAIAALVASAASAAETPTAVIPACHLVTPNVPLCRLPDGAAMIYDQFGKETAPFNQSYVLKALQAEGCSRQQQWPEWKDKALTLGRTGRFATINGYVPISEIILYEPRFGDSGQLHLWVATPYIVGTCPKFVISPITESSSK